MTSLDAEVVEQMETVLDSLSMAVRVAVVALILGKDPRDAGVYCGPMRREVAEGVRDDLTLMAEGKNPNRPGGTRPGWTPSALPRGVTLSVTIEPAKDDRVMLTVRFRVLRGGR